MRIEWDKKKNAANIIKHRISFELAKEVFADPLAQYILDRVVADEERWHAIGSVRSGFVVVVVHCYRTCSGEEIIRLISARAASSHERRLYEEG